MSDGYKADYEELEAMELYSTVDKDTETPDVMKHALDLVVACFTDGNMRVEHVKSSPLMPLEKMLLFEAELDREEMGLPPFDPENYKLEAQFMDQLTIRLVTTRETAQ